MLVHLQVLGQIADALGQQRDLNLSRAGVTVGGAVLADDLLLDVAGQGHGTIPLRSTASAPHRSSSRREKTHPASRETRYRVTPAYRISAQRYRAESVATAARCSMFGGLQRVLGRTTRWGRRGASAAQACPCLLDVVVHLLDQGVDAREALHPAQPLDELDAEAVAVEVAIVIQHECLDAPLPHVECRVCPH